MELRLTTVNWIFLSDNTPLVDCREHSDIALAGLTHDMMLALRSLHRPSDTPELTSPKYSVWTGASFPSSHGNILTSFRLLVFLHACLLACFFKNFQNSVKSLDWFFYRYFTTLASTYRRVVIHFLSFGDCKTSCNLV